MNGPSSSDPLIAWSVFPGATPDHHEGLLVVCILFYFFTFPVPVYGVHIWAVTVVLRIEVVATDFCHIPGHIIKPESIGLSGSDGHGSIMRGLGQNLPARFRDSITVFNPTPCGPFPLGFGGQ